MQTAASEATAKGRYYWELMFSFSNPENDDVATVMKHEVEVSTKRTVDTRRFVSNVFSIQSGFAFRQQTSANVTFKGVAEGGAEQEFSTHLEVANEITRTFEEEISIEEERSQRRVFHVGPGDTLDLYRLVYEFEGSVIRTDVLSTTPREDVEVELGFGVEERIVGLTEILDVLQGIRPGRDNKGEWEDIRDVIVRNRDRSYEAAFRALVEQMAATAPRRDNKDEWREIRATCDEILQEWETTNKHMLLRKLLHRFLVTKPRLDNKREWSAIRTASAEILTDLRQVF